MYFLLTFHLNGLIFKSYVGQFVLNDLFFEILILPLSQTLLNPLLVLGHFMDLLLSDCDLVLVVFEVVVLLGIVNHNVVFVHFNLLKFWPYLLDVLNGWRIEHFSYQLVLSYHLEVVEVLNGVALELGVEHLHGVDPAWILQHLLRLYPLFEVFGP